MMLPILLIAAIHASPSQTIVGDIRVEAISPTLVRIERRGPHGFEDRPTFTVTSREVYGERPKTLKTGTATTLVYANFKVQIPLRRGTGLEGVEVLSRQGKALYKAGAELPPQSFLPGPSDKIEAYALADHPRLVPPEWGATPPPPDNTLDPSTSGWDATNDAPDLYVFVPGAGGYRKLREDFLNLTGKIPMPPKWAFGFWYSRYYEYRQDEALETIDEFRKRDFPLDCFVVDTDWRSGGSDGYAVNTQDFPDMAAFIQQAHAKHAHLMFNDHPEPQTKSALDPKELEFRWNGLTSLLGKQGTPRENGIDVWWYDRNWSTHLVSPMPGIAPEVWGQRLYHDITLRAWPDERPMIMSNVEGITSGLLIGPPHPAGHRYPIMWTGDTTALPIYLYRGIENGVNAGIDSLLPYVNEDLGGHVGAPTPELYVRFLQYGAFSPIMRVHCTKGQDRRPWSFGPEAEAIVRDYVKLRYRLLPMIYSAARQAYDDGTPLLRRLDLEWPREKSARNPEEFLFGDDLLVAPRIPARMPNAATIPGSMLSTDDGQPGLKGEYFASADPVGTPVFTRVDPQVAFAWNSAPARKGFPREQFSVRWTGKIGPFPEAGLYQLGVETDDGARLWLDGKLVDDHWVGRGSTQDLTPVQVAKEQVIAVKFEYNQLGGDADAYLKWLAPSQNRLILNKSVWIPPGDWQDAWTGEVVAGPRTLSVDSPLWHTPLYVRQGSIVFAGQSSDYVGQKQDDRVVLEVYPPLKDGAVERTLYEDDGGSNGYLRGQGRTTRVRLTRRGSELSLEVLPAVGAYPGAPSKRSFIVRLHAPAGQTASPTGTMDMETLLLRPLAGRAPMPLLGGVSRPGSLAGPVLYLSLSQTPVSQGISLGFHLKPIE